MQRPRTGVCLGTSGAGEEAGVAGVSRVGEEVGDVAGGQVVLVLAGHGGTLAFTLSEMGSL